MTRFFPIPPQLSWSRELLWVLSRACARAPLPPLEPGDASLIVALARRLEVSGRIAARLGKEACRRDLGELAGESLYDDLLTNVAVASALLSAQRRVQASATRHGISVAWLKFAGLHAAGLIREGSRVASDIDLLVPEAEARKLWDVLQREAGFAKYGARGYEHQLEALKDSAGALVEVHTKLPGVVGADGKFLRFEELRRRGQLQRVSREDSFVELPSNQILAAHALAHGLLQNRAAPQAYSPLRMLCDLLDIRSVDRGAVRDAGAWLDARIGVDGAQEAERLCAVLEEPGPAALDQDPSDLLRHCLAARLDDTYAERLRGRAWADHLSDYAAWRGWASRLRWLVFPTRLELDALYGPAPSALRRLERRLLRPLELFSRARARRRAASRAR